MVILFDLDDTIIDHGSAAKIACAAFSQHFAGSLPHSPDEFPDIWNAALDRHFERFTRGEISFVEQRRSRIRDVFCKLDMPEEEADAKLAIYMQEYESSWRLFEDVIPCLDRLNGHCTGIITNGGVKQQHLKLEQTGLGGRFSTVVISEEIGLGKPSAEIFLEACRRINVKPEECIFVGDSWENDVLGSSAVGMKAVWLNRAKLPLPDSSVQAIHTLDELFRFPLPPMTTAAR